VSGERQFAEFRATPSRRDIKKDLNMKIWWIQFSMMIGSEEFCR